MTEQLTGASVWEQDLYTHLVGHMTGEGAVLAQYEKVAETTESKAFAYLVTTLIKDERRHHRTLSELASTLANEAEFRNGEPAVPYLDFDRADGAEVRSLTAQLLERENADAVELKRLRRELRSVRDTTLWDLLVANMLRDTEKHIAILEFVMDHTK